MNENSFQNFYDLDDLKKSKISAFFLSDIHLSPERPKDILALENFVEYLILIGSSAQLFFLGDIFDFWFLKASPVKKNVQSLLKKLKTYNLQNAKVTFFEGNHDVHLKYILADQFGFKVISDQEVVKINDSKLILEHGDLFNPDDTAYLFLRRFLRRPWIIILAKYFVPGVIIAGIGDYFSKKGSKRMMLPAVRDERAKDIDSKFINYGKDQLSKYSANVFIAGHTHQRLVEKTEQGQIINLGSWFDRKITLAFTPKGFEFYELK